MEIKAVLNKPYDESERIAFIIENNHEKGYEIRNAEYGLEAWGMDAAEKLQEAKNIKIQENDEKRDLALNSGVEYKGVLFDSDTDQKINLLAIVSTMSDEDEITWFGKDNIPLLCNKQDLIAIGGLITVLHNHCWTLNASIKNAISEAETIEEVEAIEINYESEVINET